MKKQILITFLFSFLISCESRTYDEISDAAPITETVKYQPQVKAIIDANCIVCHSAGGAASFRPFNNYVEVKTAIDLLLDRVQRLPGDPQKMPQGGSLSTTDINILKKWKEDGLLEN